jgi:hypothetical protein
MRLRGGVYSSVSRPTQWRSHCPDECFRIRVVAAAARAWRRLNGIEGQSGKPVPLRRRRSTRCASRCSYGQAASSSRDRKRRSGAALQTLRGSCWRQAGKPVPLQGYRSSCASARPIRSWSGWSRGRLFLSETRSARVRAISSGAILCLTSSSRNARRCSGGRSFHVPLA